MKLGRPRTTRRKLLMILAGTSLLLSACAADTSGKFGQELFEQVCAVCHGADGAGTPGRPAIGVGSNAVGLTDEQIYGVMEVGPGAMPSFRRLTPEQLDSIVEYVRVLQGNPPTD